MEKDIPGAEAEYASSPEDEADGKGYIGGVSLFRATHDIYSELRAVETKTGRMVKAVRIGEGSTFVIRKR